MKTWQRLLISIIPPFIGFFVAMICYPDATTNDGLFMWMCVLFSIPFFFIWSFLLKVLFKRTFLSKISNKYLGYSLVTFFVLFILGIWVMNALGSDQNPSFQEQLDDTVDYLKEISLYIIFLFISASFGIALTYFEYEIKA